MFKIFKWFLGIVLFSEIGSGITSFLKTNGIQIADWTHFLLSALVGGPWWLWAVLSAICLVLIHWWSNLIECWNRVIKLINRYFGNKNSWVPLKEAINKIYEKTRRADAVRWDLAGVKRKDFSYYQLIQCAQDLNISLYGYRTLDGSISSSSKLENIPNDKIPNSSNEQYKWKETYSDILISSTNEPIYTKVSIKNGDLEKILNEQKKRDINTQIRSAFISP